MVKALIGIVALGLLVMAAGFLWQAIARPTIVQPIAYSHKKHIDEGLDCKDCHQSVTTRAVAGRPKEQTCLDCHEPDELEDNPEDLSPEMVKLLTFLKNEQVIPWRRIYRIPEYVNFSHARHVEVGEVPCETCHGPMAEAERPQRYPRVRLTMQFCLNCHAQRQAELRAELAAKSAAEAGAKSPKLPVAEDVVSRDCNACHH